MTAYNAIADSDLDPESPGTTTTFTRLRDNPIAISEGSSGAPKTQTAALEQAGGSEAVTNACIRDDTIELTDKVNKTIASTGTQVLGVAAVWTIPAGLYNIVESTGTAAFRINVSSTWYGVQEPSGLVWSDGTNMQINGGVSGGTVYYQTMS